MKSIFFFIEAASAFLRVTVWAIIRRLSPGTIKVIGMPPKVRALRFKIIKTAKKDLIKNSLLTSSIASSDLKGKLLKINLCGGHFTYKDSSSWGTEFSDEEVTASLHRWRWLLPNLADDESEISPVDGLILMRSWVESRLDNDNHGLDAYSTSERAVNGSLFIHNNCSHLGEHGLGAAFKKMGIQIATNLEYYEGEITGNHALNNARGLFFIGVLHDIPDMVELSLEIIYERLPVLVTDDGFLRESSSHYHFLFTRWILEILWLSEKYELNDVLTFLRPYAYKLVKCCWFFLVRDEESGDWQIPLIGDISPDVPPTWLISLPWCNIATKHYKPPVLPKYQGPLGWAGTYGLTSGVDKVFISETLSYPKSFWHRIVKNRLVLFIHAEQSSGSVRAGHKHEDLGSFVLYYDGKLVINDPGRVDYGQSDLGLYGKSAEAHNTIFIDGLPPEVDDPSWLQRRYKANNVAIKYSTTESVSEFYVSHDGFDRLGLKDLKYHRKFSLGSDFFQIEDQIDGLKACDISLRLHLAPDIMLASLEDDSFLLSPSKAVLKVDDRLKGSVLSRETSPIGGICASEYGVYEVCDTLEMKGVCNLPVVIKTSVTWN